MPATPNPGGTRAIPASGGRALSAPPAIYSRGLVSLTARTVPGSLPWRVRGTSAAPPPAPFRAFCVDEGCRGSCRTGCWVSTSDPLPVEGGAVPAVVHVRTPRPGGLGGEVFPVPLTLVHPGHRVRMRLHDRKLGYVRTLRSTALAVDMQGLAQVRVVETPLDYRADPK